MEVSTAGKQQPFHPLQSSSGDAMTSDSKLAALASHLPKSSLNPELSASSYLRVMGVQMAGNVALLAVGIEADRSHGLDHPERQ